MERQHIFMILGIIVSMSVVSGVLGGFTYIIDKKNNDDRYTLIFFGFTEAEFKFKITSNTDWSGYYFTSIYEMIPFSGSGNQQYRFSGHKVWISLGMDSPGYVTLQIYSDGIKCYSNTITSTLDSILTTVESKRTYLIILSFLLDVSSLTNILIIGIISIISGGCVAIGLIYYFHEYIPKKESTYSSYLT